MQELTDRSGLPRTTIHHYAREGLLPPARKTAPNAARYDEAHLERLSLITRLRDADWDAGPLSIPEIRRVFEHVEAGVSLQEAVRLVAENVDAMPDKDGGWSSPAELARAATLDVEFVERLIAARLIGGEAEDSFTPADLLVAQSCQAVCADRGVDPADLTPLSDLIREVGNYSATLVEVHAVRADEASSGSARITADPTLPLGRDLAALCDVLLWRVLRA